MVIIIIITTGTALAESQIVRCKEIREKSGGQVPGPEILQLDRCKFPKTRGTLFWGPYYKDPTISATIYQGPLFLGNSHMCTSADLLHRRIGPVTLTHSFLARNLIWLLFGALGVESPVCASVRAFGPMTDSEEIEERVLALIDLLKKKAGEARGSHDDVREQVVALPG